MSVKYTPAGLFGTTTLWNWTDSGTSQVTVNILTTGLLQVTRAGTVLGTSAVALAAGEQYLEFKFVISDAGGSYEVRLNGVNILSASGVDTKNTANATANGFTINGGGAGGGALIIDDLYVCDGTGAANNSFLGDVRIDAVLPAGAGANTGMTPSAGANYQCVDENPATDDTDYVQSDVVGTKDTYDFTNITHTPTAIFGVQVNMVARKDDAGVRSIASVVRSGGADTDGTTQALTTSYLNYRQMIELDPNTAAAWTKTNLNAAEFGAKVAA
jgi:hypothetical protein